MALDAKLQFGDNSKKSYTPADTYPIIDFRLHFSRHHDLSYPDENARCQCVEVTMYAPDKTKISLYDWYINGTAQTGRISFQLPADKDEDIANTTDYLYFTSAYCYAISQTFEEGLTSSRLLKLMFAAEKIQVNDVDFPQ